jgi:hypothetical protein
VALACVDVWTVMAAGQCDVCHGIEGIKQEPTSGTRCARCISCVTALTGGLVSGGGLREDDAFPVLAKLASEHWDALPPQLSGQCKSAIDRKAGLVPAGLNHPLRRWLFALLRSAFPSVEYVDKGRTDEGPSVKDHRKIRWRYYIRGVQLAHGADTTQHDARGAWTAGALHAYSGHPSRSLSHPPPRLQPPVQMRA